MTILCGYQVDPVHIGHMCTHAYISYPRHGVPVSVDNNIMVMTSHTAGTTNHNNSKIKLSIATNVKVCTYLHFYKNNKPI